MIYIGFTHFWTPIIFGTLSYFSNSIFIYVVLLNTRANIGAYKYMLVCFGLFDITYSTVDMLVAMGSHSEGNTFCVFVTHGPFSNVSSICIGVIKLCLNRHY